MINKSIFLALFLVPFTMVGNNSKNTRIQKLEEKFHQKEQELATLSEMISKKDEILLEFHSESQELLRLIANKRIIRLESKNNGKPLSQEEEDKVREDVRCQANEFIYKFFDLWINNKSIKGILSKGLFYEDKATEVVEFESLKFYLIKRIFNLHYISNLVERYEDCLAEYRTLMNEIIDLQKQQTI